MEHQSPPSIRLIVMWCLLSCGVSLAQESADRDFQSTVDRLYQAELHHIEVLHEAYLHSIETLGVDDQYTKQLLDRLLFESNPVSLIKGNLLFDTLTDFHLKSQADIETTTALILKLWKRFDTLVVENPRPTEIIYRNMVPPGGYYPSGVAPSAVREPEIRAEYENMLRKNKLNGMQLSRAMRAEKTQNQFVMKLICAVGMPNLSEQDRNYMLKKLKESGRIGVDSLFETLGIQLPSG